MGYEIFHQDFIKKQKRQSRCGYGEVGEGD